MRLVFGLVFILSLLGQIMPSVAQALPVDGTECESYIRLYPEMKTIVMSIGCGGIILSREKALEIGRVFLTAAGYSEYDHLYSATPVLPDSDGTTSLWALIVVDVD